jgi:hypothetical protein
LEKSTSIETSRTGAAMSLYQCECPECENIVCGGGMASAVCSCGQNFIVRDLTSEEELTDYEALLELQIEPKQ